MNMYGHNILGLCRSGMKVIPSCAQLYLCICLRMGSYNIHMALFLHVCESDRVRQMVKRPCVFFCLC